MANEPESQFNQRADNAALALKQGLVDARTGEPLQSVPVAVGPDGQRPPDPPPEGSYVAMAQQQQQQQVAPQPPPQQPPPPQQQLPPEPGPVAQQLPPQAPAQQDNQGDLSPNAQSRFNEMSARLRSMEQQLQQTQQEAAARAESEQQLRAALEQAQAQHQAMLEQHLDDLDPDERARVLADTRIQELMGQMQERMEQRFMPAIQALEIENQRQKMLALAQKYAAFDISVHGPLIEMFRQRNPASSVEQAFRAVAQDGELVTRNAAPLQAVPPIVHPGMGTSSQRYVPEPKPDPDAQIREDAARVAELMRSSDPNERKAGMRLIDKNLADRLKSQFPG